MGKGTIISGGDHGQYQLQINYDRTQYNSQIALLDAQITDYGEKITDLDERIADKQSEIDAESVLEELNRLALELEELRTSRSITNLRKVGFEKRKAFLQNHMPSDETVSAWCADYTEDLSGVVGTIEVPGYEYQGVINIRPGYDDDAAWSEANDKQLLPEITMSANQSYYNRAVLPAVSKWRPTYRYGTITETNGTTASVTLDDATSTQQDLNINQSSTLTGVPFDYMNCDGIAFQADDEVIIEFIDNDWNDPVIIGFKDNPSPCDCYYVQLIENNVDVDNSTPWKTDTPWNYWYPVPSGTGTPTYIDGLKPESSPFNSTQYTGGCTYLSITIEDVPDANNGEVVDMNLSWYTLGDEIVHDDFEFTEDYTVNYYTIYGQDRIIIPYDYAFVSDTGTWTNNEILNYTAPSEELPSGGIEVGSELDFKRQCIQWRAVLTIKETELANISAGYKYMLFEVTELEDPDNNHLGCSLYSDVGSSGGAVSSTGKYYIKVPSNSNEITKIQFDVRLSYGGYVYANCDEEVYSDTHKFKIKDLRFCSVLPDEGETEA